MTSKGSSANSGLVILVPEADSLVGRFRDKYDPSAAAGMPAHITLLYPFLLPADIAEPQIDILRRCFAGIAPFHYSLSEVRLFPAEVMYLAPDPEAPFTAMTLAIWRDFPGRPPYGGRHSDIVPHLTVAQVADKNRLDEVTQDFKSEIRGKMPIAAKAGQAALMDDAMGRWKVRALFRLGHG